MARNIGLEITRFGTPPLTFQKKVATMVRTAREASVDIGKATRDHMRNIIATQKHRKSGSTGNLERSIDVVVERGGTVVGVGYIPEMDQVAPYWYLINYGGLNAPARQGRTIFGNFDGDIPRSDLAGTGVGTQSFFQSSPLHPMKPVNPVWAMNYIDKTINWVSTIWRVHYSSRINKVQINTFSTSGITLG